jgi:hypothetical protein
MVVQIIHRIALTANESDKAQVARLGVKLRPSGRVPVGFISFDISESSENWRAVEEWIRRRRPSDVARTEFSRAEVDAAPWLTMETVWHQGYPQPEDGFEYLRTTYDAAGYCDRCGTGAVQKAPFVMSAEPRWGTRGILQMNWVFDEFFVRPEVAAQVLAPFGITTRPVHSKRGGTLGSVAQIVIEDRVSVDHATLAASRCAACGRVKYLPVSRGPLSRLEQVPQTNLSRTHEWFGSGAEAHNEIVASQGLARALKAAGVKGVSFRPIAE